MSNVGQLERKTQNRVVTFFKEQLDYDDLGDWEYREGNSNIETDLLTKWLKNRGISESLIKRTLRKLDAAAALGEGKKLYDANKEVYRLLRYGVKEKEGTGEQNQTVWLIDWENPKNNDFAIAEEVTVKGELKKRPDIVIYVNGIALGVIELKRSSVSVSEGIRQNLDNQKKDFIRNFFTTMQLVMAGNLELAKKPFECMEYILVHELIHLLERHHNQRFRSLMDKHMPNWRERRDLLNSLPLAYEDWSY